MSGPETTPKVSTWLFVIARKTSLVPALKLTALLLLLLECTVVRVSVLVAL